MNAEHKLGSSQQDTMHIRYIFSLNHKSHPLYMEPRLFPCSGEKIISEVSFLGEYKVLLQMNQTLHLISQVKTSLSNCFLFGLAFIRQVLFFLSILTSRETSKTNPGNPIFIQSSLNYKQSLYPHHHNSAGKSQSASSRS